jgi:hypothetical protein
MVSYDYPTVEWSGGGAEQRRHYLGSSCHHHSHLLHLLRASNGYEKMD